MKAAAAGKHVLVEKPVGVKAADVEDIIAACARHRVQFMDGVMFMHSGRLPLVRQVLDDGTSVGNIRRITSQFSFAAPPEFLTGNIRADHALEPLGCLGDLGWYNSRLTLFVMDYQMPEFIPHATPAMGSHQWRQGLVEHSGFCIAISGMRVVV